MASDVQPDGTVKSDETVFAIVEALQRLDGSGVTALAADLGLAKSTVHKHLKTLEAHDYVVNDDGVYRIGFRFLSHGGYVRDGTTICNLARKTVLSLAEETDELIAFAVMEHQQGMFTFMHNDHYGLREEVHLGERFPLHQTAAGKAILADLPDERVDEIVDAVGLPAAAPESITTREELADRLARIRERGYAVSTEEHNTGVQAIGVAVYDPSDDIHGALSLSVPVSQLTDKKIESKYKDTMIEAADRLNLKMQYSG